MLNSVPLGALRPFGGAPSETSKGSDLPDYSQSPVHHSSGVPLGAVIRKATVSNAGDVTVLGHWNYELETWEPEFNAASHVQPLKRLNPDPTHFDYKSQTFAAPYLPFADRSAFVTFYTLGEDGAPKDVWCSEERDVIASRANLDR